MFTLFTISKGEKIKVKTNLKIATLIKCLRWSEYCNFPFEHIVLVDEFHSKTLDWFLLKAFVLERQGAYRATRWLRHSSNITILLQCKKSLC